jgi:hypothetical protein
VAESLNFDFYFEVSAFDVKSVKTAMEQVIHHSFCTFRKKEVLHFISYSLQCIHNGIEYAVFVVHATQGSIEVPSNVLSLEKKAQDYFGLPSSERIVGEFGCMRKIAHGTFIVMTSCVCFLPIVLPKKVFAFCVRLKDIKKIQLRQMIIVFATGVTFITEDQVCPIPSPI